MEQSITEVLNCLRGVSFYYHNEILTGFAVLISLYAIKKADDSSKNESKKRMINLKYDLIHQLMIFSDDISLEISKIELEEKELEDMQKKVESKMKESDNDFLLKVKNDILGWRVDSKLTSVKMLESKSIVNFLLNQLSEAEEGKLIKKENPLTVIKKKIPIEKYNFEKIVVLTNKRRDVIKKAKENALDKIIELS